MSQWTIERLSIELTNRCTKACDFCYNASHSQGDTQWTADEIVEFVLDCQLHGTEAVSFGGGEPLQFVGLFEILHRLENRLFRSITTNGLLLNGERLEKLVAARPNKVHISIHYPDDTNEVARVIAQVHDLSAQGIRSGVNLLVRQSNLTQTKIVAKQLRESGINNECIVYLPMRVYDSPTPEQVANVAGDLPFQSMTCLTKCAASPRFCSIGWDKSVAWCSYTQTRRKLETLDHSGLTSALNQLGLTFCGAAT